MKHFDSQLLAEIIGFPSIESVPSRDLIDSDFTRIFPLAVKNKVPLLFLEKSLKIRPESKFLIDTYQSYLGRVNSSKSLINNIVEVLDRAELDYAIFKTIKPFSSFGADVDVILFSRKSFYDAWSHLVKNGCELAGYGAFSATLYSAPHVMNVDLHFQIGVSRLIYLDVRLLQDHVVRINYDKSSAPILDNQASFVADVTHSIYKEQLLTLSDFYVVANGILSMNSHQLESTLDLVKKAHATFSAKAVLLLTDRLTRLTFNRTIPAIVEAAELINVNRIEAKVINFLMTRLELDFKLPFSYPLLAVAAAFLLKLPKDPTMRGTLAGQSVELVTNLPYLWENIGLHMKGEVS